MILIMYGIVATRQKQSVPLLRMTTELMEMRMNITLLIKDLIIIHLWENIRSKVGGNTYMNIREMMESVPNSYDDFVNTVVSWTSKDENIKTTIIKFVRDNPSSSTSDILGVLWDCLGIGEPIEIVDDDDLQKKKVTVAML